MNIESWAWLVVPLGACRAMQITLWDRVLDRPRGWLMGRLNPDDLPLSDSRRSYLSYLLECPWCISVWIGAAIVLGLAFETTREPTLWVLTVLAISLASVVIDRLIDQHASDEDAAARAAALAPPPAPAPPPPSASIPAEVAAAFDAAEGGRPAHSHPGG